MPVERVTIGMKRAMLEKLRDDLSDELRTTPPNDTVEINVYGDVDEHGIVLVINNDDMERPEIPDGAVYFDND